MSHLIFPNMIVWLCLAISILCALSKPYLWRIPLLITLIAAFYLNHITPIGLIVVIAGLGIAYLSANTTLYYLKAIGHIAIVLWLLALSLHVMPGFNNLLVLDSVKSGVNSQPFTLHFNLDKPMLIFALLILVPNMLNRSEFNWRDKMLSPKQSLIILAGIPLIIFIAYSAKLVTPEFSLPDWWWLFAFNNLLFTCVAEEVFFRGYIQKMLCQRYTPAMGIGIASLLFGIAHFSGGLTFVLIATLAGLVYGLSYYWSNKLSVAITVHFSFNLIHLTFFTYPLAR